MSKFSFACLAVASVLPSSAVYAQAVHLAGPEVATSAAPVLEVAAAPSTSDPISVPAAAPVLPDSPGALAPAAAAAFGGRDNPNPPPAEPYDLVVLPNQQAPRMTVGNKIVAGLKDSVSPFSIAAWLINAGYEQLLTASPNYELTTDGIGGQFGKRLGAAAARDISQEVFGVSVLAPILHEDPRYYKLGRTKPFGRRAVYAATRALITRTDSGHLTVNLQSIGGNLAGAYLTKAYYPAFNSTNSEVLKTFGGSVGGTALGYAVTEFLPNLLQIVHLQ